MQANGVYLLGQLLLIPVARMDSAHEVALRAGVLRALRYVYAVERNRTVFKRLFTPDTYALFIDVGHYQSDITWCAPSPAACKLALLAIYNTITKSQCTRYVTFTRQQTIHIRRL